MNILFISHCDFMGNSAMHIFSIANQLLAFGLNCVVCIPERPETVFLHGIPRFQVFDFPMAKRDGVRFPDGRGPDLIHAWTPRERVRKLTLDLVERHRCPYIVHLEDNEEAILENELCPPQRAKGSPCDQVPLTVPDYRIHPSYYREFLANAAGITVLMDRLFEFKPEHVPGVVFWPGFDEEYSKLPWVTHELRSRFGLTEKDRAVAYTGNVHASNRREVRSLFLSVGLLNRRGYPVKIIKTGRDDVDALADDLEGLRAFTIDLGFRPRAEIPSIIALADVLIQPGRPDRFNDYRFPSKLPEWLVSGKPVVLPKTNIGRFLVDGVEALLLKEGHAIEIAGKIETLLKDGRLRQAIGEGGRQFALRELQWPDNVKIVKDFYERLLSPARENALGVSPSNPDGETASRRPKPDTPSIHSPVSATRDLARSANSRSPRLIAFYLPQFHPIKENDEWWGKGFTEWRNVVKARPSFHGHYQPHLPTDLGYYDLRVPEVMDQQAELAQTYGIAGFCYYYYWFNGHRLLERPLNEMLQRGKPDFPFCICWANENWTRRWDGAEEELLIKQVHCPESDAQFIRDVIPILKDPRYIKVQGKPILLVYRANILPTPLNTTRTWRDICAEEGIPSIHLCAIQSFGLTDPRPYGFDAGVEFPPHNDHWLINPRRMPGLEPDFEGNIEDYFEVAYARMNASPTDYVQYRGIMPSWDNTARRGKRAHILINSSPTAYEHWLRFLVAKARERSSIQESLIFVNAWNEWAEGTHLEPDEKYGYAYLEATRRALLV